MLYCTWNGKKGPFKCQIWSDLLSDGRLKDARLGSTWNCYFRAMNKYFVQCCGSWFICVSGLEFKEGQERPAIGAGQVELERSYYFDRFHKLQASKSVPSQDYKCCRLGESLLLQDSKSPRWSALLLGLKWEGVPSRTYIYRVLQASESVPLQDHKFPERSTLPLGQEQISPFAG